MGQIQFTHEQKIILDVIAKEKFFRSSFYFTGGTALSYFYLQHRYSEDLDFFGESKFENQIILSYVEKWSKEYGFTYTSNFAEVVYIFLLTFKNKERIKLDFAYYPYKRIEKGKILNGVSIDSLTDIAVNKLLTITQRVDVKDFVDLYFLLKTFTIWDLLEGLRVKFGMKIEPFILSSDFLKVEDFEYLPRMIKPLTLEQLKSFFREQAKKISKRSVE